MKKKLTLVVTCVVLVAAMVIGGTLAYFTDTKSAENTFTVGNVKIELLDMFVKNKKVVGMVNIVLCGLSGVALAYFSYLSLTYMFKLQGYGDVTAGLGIPIWILEMFMVISCAMMALYYGINLVKKILAWKEMGTK